MRPHEFKKICNFLLKGYYRSNVDLKYHENQFYCTTFYPFSNFSYKCTTWLSFWQFKCNFTPIDDLIKTVNYLRFETIFIIFRRTLLFETWKLQSAAFVCSFSWFCALIVSSNAMSGRTGATLVCTDDTSTNKVPCCCSASLDWMIGIVITFLFFHDSRWSDLRCSVVKFLEQS